jgi:hypothetical protein
MAAVAGERWLLAAALCALAAHLKVYSVALGLLLSAAYPRQFAGRWLLALALGGFLPFAFGDPDYVARQYRDWSEIGLKPRDNHEFQTLRLAYEQWIAPMPLSVYHGLALVGAAFVAAASWIQFRRGSDSQARQNLLFALVCAWMTALGPSTEAETYAIVAAPLAAAFIGVWSESHSRWLRAAITLAAIVDALWQLELMFPLGQPVQKSGAIPFTTGLFMVALAYSGFPTSLTPTVAQGSGQAVAPPRLPAPDDVGDDLVVAGSCDGIRNEAA